ncbi:hypothetical protein C8Q72DRAFT_261586 [Fomitopsis betulina]|nr:hypothetical protein C8Q72DRAFT_261586 [Fomitopsis betulina]
MTEPWVAWGDADNFADDAWEIACLEADINVDALVPDKAIRNLIKDRIPQLRSAMKKIARELVPGQYGFQSGRSDTILAENRELVERLKGDRLHVQDHLNPVTACRNPIFTDILARTCRWFTDKKDDGYRYPQYFTAGHSMQVLIAQLLTIVECAIDEWKTGAHKELEFRETTYAAIYDSHLEWLAEWEKYSKTHSQADVHMQEDMIRALRHRASGDDSDDERVANGAQNVRVQYNFSQFESFGSSSP